MRKLGDQQPLLTLPFGLRLLPFRYIDKGHDDAFDLIVKRAVRTHAHQVPATVLAANGPLDKCKVCQNSFGIRSELRILEPVREIRNRTALVPGRYAEDVSQSRRKTIDVQTAAEK